MIGNILLVWLLGLAPIFPVICSFYAFYKYGFGLLSMELSGVYLIFSYVVLYIVSIWVNVGFDFDERVFGALYNVSLWLCGACCYLYGAKLSENNDSYTKLAGEAYRLLLFVFLVGVPLVFFFEDASEMVFPSLIGSFINLESLPPHAKASASLTLLVPDWGTENAIGRLSILAPYSNALAGLAIVLFGFVGFSRDNKKIFLAALLMVGICILTRSRVAIAISLLVFFVYFIIERFFSGKVEKGVAIGLLAIVISGVYFFSQGISSEQVSIERESSDDLRKALYVDSIEMAMDASPMFGFGVKPRLESYEMPLGSHSTYVGAIFKTGVLGFFLVTLFFLLTFYDGLKLILSGVVNRLPYLSCLGGVTCGMCVFFALEDLDAPQLLNVLFFVFIGFCHRFLRLGRYYG